MNNLVLFDFDGTITTKDTTKILFIELLKLRPLRLFKAGWLILKTYFERDFKKKQDYKNLTIGYLISGHTDLSINNALDIFKKKVEILCRPTILEKINTCIMNDEIVVVVTASPSFAVKYFFLTEQVNVIGTRFKKKDKVFNGKLNSNPCYGEEKVSRINEWLSENIIEYNISEGWSDDFSDLPMLKMAKKRFWIGDRKLKNTIDKKDPNGKFILG
jgi:HAD superfamily hydrolase (TIGR01490 family)